MICTLRVLAIGLVLLLGTGWAEEPADLVRPLVGTDSSFELSRGNCYPAVSLPFGMTAWTPQTVEKFHIYRYDDERWQGFRATHSPSVWMGDYGHFSIMPLAGAVRVDPRQRSARFEHADEEARPYYYRVLLREEQITAELAPSGHSAVMAFTYAGEGPHSVLVDAHAGGSRVEVDPAAAEVRGYNAAGRLQGRFPCYFVARFEQPFTAFATRDGEKLQPDRLAAEGEHAAASLRFAQNQVRMKVGTSFISLEQARRNLEQEIPGWSVEEVANEARSIWNRELGRIEVEGGPATTFYTALYRALLFPRSLDEFGRYRSPFDFEVHQGPMFVDTGFWDTYRAQFPLLVLMMPDRVSQVVQGLVSAYEQGGWIPKWPAPGYTSMMVGTHADSVVADAYLKGVRGFDAEKAYRGMRKHATTPGDNRFEGRKGIEDYQRFGYVPADRIEQATSRTLDFAYDDFCVARMAAALGKAEDSTHFAERAGNYRNVYDPEVGFFRGRNADGSWPQQFSPLAWGGPFTEGCAWHFLWSVQHDIPGLVELLGGREAFIARLDRLFELPPDYEVGGYPHVIHEMREVALTGMGQYAHNNQPMHHVLYLYNFVGQPWKTQRRVREALERLYTDRPDGLVGDEDNGQMSAWYIFSALGFYPVTPGELTYAIGSPLFKRATMKLPGEKRFTVEARGEGPYIQRASLNGAALERAWLQHSEVAEGGHLIFEMGLEPSAWATD